MCFFAKKGEDAGDQRSKAINNLFYSQAEHLKKKAKSLEGVLHKKGWESGMQAAGVGIPIDLDNGYEDAHKYCSEPGATLWVVPTK